MRDLGRVLGVFVRVYGLLDTPDLVVEDYMVPIVAEGVPRKWHPMALLKYCLKYHRNWIKSTGRGVGDRRT